MEDGEGYDYNDCESEMWGRASPPSVVRLPLLSISR